jgi:hypothetical protein
MHELQPPPIAQQTEAYEVLRVWSGDSLPQQFVLQTTWSDPAAWGLLLVDVAQHVARAYAATTGLSADDALARIKSGFDAEWSDSTDVGIELHE